MPCNDNVSYWKTPKTHDQHKLSKNMQNCLKFWDSTVNWVYREHFWGKIETLCLSWELDLDGTLRKEHGTKICGFAHISCFKINPPIFCCPLFSENYLNPQVRISKMANKYTINYHPSPLQLISRIDPLIFICTSKGFISPESFLKPVYSTMVAEKFQIYSVKITRNT